MFNVYWYTLYLSKQTLYFVLNIFRKGEDIRPDPELINMEAVQNLVDEFLEIDLENLNPTLELRDPLQPVLLNISNLYL